MNEIARRAPIRVTQIVTTLARGGAQATVVASSRLPADAGFEVRVLAGPGQTGEGTFWGDSALDDLLVDVVPDLERSIRPRRDLMALRWLITHLRADRPDVVHTHSSKAGVLGRLAAAAVGVPCIHTVHGWGPLDAAAPTVRRGVVVLEQMLARRTAALVVVGRGDRERGLALGIGRPAQYRLIRSGVELLEPGTGRDRGALRNDVREELGLSDRWVVGMVGRLAEQKDQAGLIEAFAKVAPPDGTLILVGDGHRRALLADRAAAHPGLDIRFLGARPDGARVVAGFDLAVSAAHWEGLPRAVVEAAAAGVPIVASDVGSTADLVVPGRSGRLVPPGDVTALAEAIAEARRDPTTTAALAEEAKRLVSDYSADQMRDDLYRLWAEVAGRSACETALVGP